MNQGQTGAWIKPDWRLSLLRVGMRTLGAIHTGLAARAMDRIWFDAPRTRPKPDARARLDAGERLEFKVHGHRVATWSWGTGPAVLLLHGWGGHAGQMHAFVDPLLDASLRVVAFDAPAHGESGRSRLGGHRVSFFEISEVLQVVAASAGPLAGIVAHSGGCAAAALAMRQGWEAPAKIAFVSPFALPSSAIGAFAQAIGANERVAERFRSGVERRFGCPWSYFDIPGLPEHLKTRPLLVVHDAEDREVPFTHGQAVADAWPQARLVATRGLGHRRLLQDPAVVSCIVGFIAIGLPRAQPSHPADARGELDLAYENSGLPGRHWFGG
ncbi:MAG: alpha/beta fold hydrolase [Pseudoxanthomonas sp.]